MEWMTEETWFVPAPIFFFFGFMSPRNYQEDEPTLIDRAIWKGWGDDCYR
jgi:hypothetical protein